MPLRAFVATYVDDFLVYSTTFREHIDHLRQVFELCRAKRIALSLKKSLFAQTSIDMLGFRLGFNSLSMRQQALDTIAAIQTPTGPRQVQQFLGLAGYYRRFIAHFADVAAPLTSIAHVQRNLFSWTAEAQQAFVQLRDTLMAAPVLRVAVRPGQVGYQPFVLYTDASDIAIAGVLSQASAEAGDDGGRVCEHPVTYWPRQLTGPERNYNVTEREALAIVYCLRKGRVTLLGVPHFTIVTDHQPLVFWLPNRTPSVRLARWLMQLQAFSCMIRYRPGSSHGNVDALTRLSFMPGEHGTVTARDPSGAMQPQSFIDNGEVLGPVGAQTVPAGSARPVQTMRDTGASVLVITRRMQRAADMEQRGHRPIATAIIATGEGADQDSGIGPGTSTSHKRLRRDSSEPGGQEEKRPGGPMPTGNEPGVEGEWPSRWPSSAWLGNTQM